MNEVARTAALEAFHGRFRVYLGEALVRGYWAAEDAHQAASELAHAGRPATVRKVPRDWMPAKPIAASADML